MLATEVAEQAEMLVVSTVQTMAPLESLSRGTPKESVVMGMATPISVTLSWRNSVPTCWELICSLSCEMGTLSMTCCVATRTSLFRLDLCSAQYSQAFL